MSHAPIAQSDRPLEEVWQDSIRGSPILGLYSRWYVKCYLIDRRDFSEACTTPIHPAAGIWNEQINRLILESRKKKSYEDVLKPNLRKIQEDAKLWTRSSPTLIPASGFGSSHKVLPPIQTHREQVREENLKHFEEEEKAAREARAKNLSLLAEDREAVQAGSADVLVHRCSADRGRGIRKEMFEQ